MKQQGESVVKIANRLNLDVKTVNLYLGNAPLPAESTAGNEFDG
jgi:predicted transcriptional regulator